LQDLHFIRIQPPGDRRRWIESSAPHTQREKIEEDLKDVWDPLFTMKVASAYTTPAVGSLSDAPAIGTVCPLALLAGNVTGCFVLTLEQERMRKIMKKNRKKN